MYYLAYKGVKEISLITYRRNGTSVKESLSLDSYSDPPKFSGWERTSQGKLSPKLADLGSLIDPMQLAEQAVELNLKLMKWRIAPDIDLDIIKEQKSFASWCWDVGKLCCSSINGMGCS